LGDVEWDGAEAGGEGFVLEAIGIAQAGHPGERLTQGRKAIYRKDLQQPQFTCLSKCFKLYSRLNIYKKHEIEIISLHILFRHLFSSWPVKGRKYSFAANV
jgi:hypothetical protein